MSLKYVFLVLHSEFDIRKCKLLRDFMKGQIDRTFLFFSRKRGNCEHLTIELMKYTSFQQ